LGSLIDKHFRDVKVIHIDIRHLLLSVGHGRLQNFADNHAGLLFPREMKDRQCLSHVPVSDQISDQPALLRRYPHMLGNSLGNRFFLVGIHFYFFILTVRIVFDVWPLKVLVGENSPSLCPTMFSVMKTGMNFFPLWTAIVKPTISGMTVERRDHVLITCLFSF
jgi:hypothetical protein